MNELAISCDIESPEKEKSSIMINIENQFDNKLLYKYIIGCNGTWSVLKDFTHDKNVKWIPKKDGKYIVMVQAKRENSNKSFDYISRMNYIIGDAQEKLINNIFLNKDRFTLGDKIKVAVDTNRYPLMFRYWIKVQNWWRLVKDYSTENTLTYTVKSENSGEILVECKDINSQSDFDDFKKIDFYVDAIKKVEILDFKCLNSELISGSEISFQVVAKYEEDRTILYKFFKIDLSGKSECIQNYSTRRTVSYVEKKEGSYKLLCLAKDMYSTSSFDDRAILNFNVKKYREIIIKNFMTDLNSPQLTGTDINISAQVTGGRELVYRYVIEGNESHDSGYIRSSNYLWNSKSSGEYRIMLFVKDISCSKEYEACEYMNFTIDEKSSEPVNIQDFTLNRNDKILKGELVRAVVSASGGTDLKYGFLIREDGRNIENIDYSRNNWIEFIPKEKGEYELEVLVKDNYSKRKYDCHMIKTIEVFDCIPANIDYILYPIREYYMVGEEVSICIIAQDTKNVLVKYVMSINGHDVEETDFIQEKEYEFTPKCSGRYSLEVFAKNIKSDAEFDCKKRLNIEIRDTIPVTDTKLVCQKNKFLINEPATFYANNCGGKNVIYEFYVMEKGNWILVQGYSRKNGYTFIPFDKDEYKVMVLCKDQYSREVYEDYDIFTFKAI
ncbi:triple tyrosine motif-containing protein [Clostridium sp. LBM24168]